MKQFPSKPTRVFNEYLKIQNIILTSIELEVQVLNQNRQLYNPNKFICQIQKAYKSNNLTSLISAISYYSYNTFIFYFFPIWIIGLPFYLFVNLKIWRATWLKTSFLIFEYKVWTRHLLLANWKGTLDLKIIISFFPFIFGISYIISSRYQNQVFSYFIQKNLPGIYPSFPRLKWDTFQNITSYQLPVQPTSLAKLLVNKNSLLPQEIAPWPLAGANAGVPNLQKSDSKVINGITQIGEVPDLSSVSNYNKDSTQASYSQSSIMSAFKLNSFIKQLDFYTDSFLIKLNSAWINKKKQVYIGFFPKKYFSQSSHYLIDNKYSGKATFDLCPPKTLAVEKKVLFNPKTNYQIGNNWNLISPKESITFSAVVDTKFYNPAAFFSDELEFMNSTPVALTVTRCPDGYGKGARGPCLKKVDLHFKPKINNYWEVFYLSLDELPKKLNSRSLSISSDKLSNLNVDNTAPLLPIQNYLYEYKDFLRNIFSKDKKNSHQMSIAKSVSKKGREVSFKYQKIHNLLNVFPSTSFQKNQLVRPKIYSVVNNAQLTEPTFFLNKAAPVASTTNCVSSTRAKENFNFKNRVETIDGFSTMPPFRGFEEDYLRSKFLGDSKDNLLQNKLRKYSYNNGLTPLPDFLKIAPNLNTYKNVLSFLLDKSFLSHENNTLEQNNKDKNTGVRDQQEIEEYCSEQVLQILQKFRPFKINIAIKPRLMSGYEFPDTSNIELRSLILQHFYQTTVLLNNNPLAVALPVTRCPDGYGKGARAKYKKQTKSKIFSPVLKVELPPSFTSYLNYNYSNFKTPSFKFKYAATSLEGVKEMLYEGPGVLRDNLTQDLDLTNKDEIQHWIKQSFSSENPLTDRREIFFGQNKTKVDSPNNQLANEKKNQQTTFLHEENGILDENLADLSTPESVMRTSNLSFQTYDLNGKYGSSLDPGVSFIPSVVKADAEIRKVKNHISESLIPKTGGYKLDLDNNLIDLPVLPFLEEFQVPYLTNSEWQTIFEKLRDNFEEQLEDKSELEKKFQVDIPVIRILNPKQQNVQWPLNPIDYKNLNDFIFSPKANLGAPISHFPQKTNSSIILKDITYKGVKKKSLPSISYHYLPSAQILLNDTLPQKRTFGTNYKKVFTFYKNILENKYESLKCLNQEKKKNYATRIFTKKFSTVFYQSWEPITTGSWMMITQLSFGLVVLQILQEFYRKYGKELLSYLLDLIVSLGLIDETLQAELELDDGGKGFRLIKKVPKRFRDIAGIDNILPELGEIVWFLRNSGRSFKIGNIIPKGILLIGSPGTGKTLLVQAIAGEAEVPVLVQSGSSLNDPEQEGDGAQSLKNLFEKARQMAPCIVFIDEIDALGEKRENIIQNPMGTDEIIESIQEHINFANFSNKQFIPKPKITFDEGQGTQQRNFSAHEEEASLNRNLESAKNFNLDIMQQSSDKQQSKHEQLSLLMQFLIEMDGLRTRKGVIVIGATNRPDVLDLALTRPGRFDQTLHLQLPEKQKRIEILKLYSKNIGTIKNISWDYLANRTVGFSAADLAAVMNESSMKAILDETIHTIETIEKGIESITSYSSGKIKREITDYVDPFFISRLAYYQAGKAVVHTLLLQHPAITVLHLWQKKKNARHTYISSIIQNKFLKSSRKLELESRVVGLYAGKAAELLILSNNLSFTSVSAPTREFLPKDFRSTEKIVEPNSIIGDSAPNLGLEQTSQNVNNKSQSLILERQQPLPTPSPLDSTVIKGSLITKGSCFSLKELWQSDIGIEDLTFATYLVESMISKWYFYSQDLVVRSSNQILHQQNLQEIKELDTIDLFNELAIEVETTIIKKTRSSGLERDLQKWSIRPWWQTQVTQQIGVLDPAYDDWYRIYLPDPQESERNEEWVPPDEYYHNNNQLSDLASNSNNCSIDWNDLYIHDRDYISHGLLLTCFNTAFTILDKNRELLDYLAAYLMRNEILREYEMNDILLQFKPNLALKINLERKHNPTLAPLPSPAGQRITGRATEEGEIETEELASVKKQHQNMEPNFFGLGPDKVNSLTPLDLEGIKAKQQQISLEKIDKSIIIGNSWGPYSRRKMCRFFTF